MVYVFCNCIDIYVSKVYVGYSVYETLFELLQFCIWPNYPAIFPNYPGFSSIILSGVLQTLIVLWTQVDRISKLRETRYRQALNREHISHVFYIEHFTSYLHMLKHINPSYGNVGDTTIPKISNQYVNVYCKERKSIYNKIQAILIRI